MHIIVISPSGSKHRQYQITLTSFFLLIGLLITAVIGVIYSMGQPKPLNTSSIYALTSVSAIDVESLVAEKNKTELNENYAKRLGRLQAEAMRLEALTEKLASMAGLDITAFVLQKEPAQGGLKSEGEAVSKADFEQGVAGLSQQFNQQSQHLGSIEHFLITDDSIQSAIPQGSPLAASKGWLSSNYGYRIDPFSGKKTFHHGIDFAGKEGAEIIAVAEGIISWTGKRTGYGQLVEIDHGNGYVTRYAHNKKLLVKVGDRIKKGHAIAMMGSTGRSTGPHVHFEVLQDGKIINPDRFVKSGA